MIGHPPLHLRSRPRPASLCRAPMIGVFALFGLLCAPLPAAQPQPSTQVWRVPAGTYIDAVLRTSIDTRYTVAHSSVVALVTRDVKRHGHMLIPRGTQLLGRVLISHPAHAGQPAVLQIQFQQALLASGDTAPLSASISSLFTSARRAALDNRNIRVGAPAPEGTPTAGRAPEPAPSYHSPGATSMPPVPAPPAAALNHDNDDGTLPPQHPSDELRDSDGVPLHIGPASEKPETGTVLTGRGPTIRLNAGTKIEVQLLHSVPVPYSANH